MKLNIKYYFKRRKALKDLRMKKSFLLRDLEECSFYGASETAERIVHDIRIINEQISNYGGK